jgi:hypothetical protein
MGISRPEGQAKLADRSVHSFRPPYTA